MYSGRVLDPTRVYKNSRTRVKAAREFVLDLDEARAMEQIRELKEMIEVMQPRDVYKKNYASPRAWLRGQKRLRDDTSYTDMLARALRG